MKPIAITMTDMEWCFAVIQLRKVCNTFPIPEEHQSLRKLVKLINDNVVDNDEIWEARNSGVA